MKTTAKKGTSKVSIYEHDGNVIPKSENVESEKAIAARFVNDLIEAVDKLPSVETVDIPGQLNAAKVKIDKFFIESTKVLFEDDSFTFFNAEGGVYYLTVTSLTPSVEIPLGTPDGLKQLTYYRNRTGKNKLKPKILKEYYDHLTQYVKNEIKPIKQEPRVFMEDDKIYYDLHDTINPKYVEITKSGYTIRDGRNDRFRIYDTQDLQVLPVKGGSLDLLDKYLNMDSEQQLLLKVFLVCAFIPGFPHPLMLVDGEAGSSKSTLTVFLKKLIDPSTVNSLSMPLTQDDLYLDLDRHYFVPFDNLSGISQRISDDICKAVTGVGISKREHYTMDNSFVRKYMRIILVNGISFGKLREDFLDRCLSFHLSRISDENRKPIKDIEKDFEEDRPLILGAIFDAVSKALSIIPTVKLDNLSRMADFEKYGYACANALGDGLGDKFITVYRKCVKEQKERAVEDNPILSAITRFMEDKENWKGSMTDFILAFTLFSKDNSLDYILKELPNPSVLGKKLTGFKGLLSEQGVIVNEAKKGGKGNIWEFVSLPAKDRIESEPTDDKVAPGDTVKL